MWVDRIDRNIGLNIRRAIICCAMLSIVVATNAAFAGDKDEPWGQNEALGETIYVPAYSQVQVDERNRVNLSSTLVIHNVDPKTTIRLKKVGYYNSNGKLVQALLTIPVELSSFQSTHFVIDMRDDSGGVGANFLVEWEAEETALGAIAEAIMIGGGGTQGISFTSRGRVIKRHEPVK